MFNKWKIYLESLGFSYIKETILIAVSNFSCLLLSLVLYFLTKQLFISLSFLLSLILVNIFFYYRYSSKKKEILDSHEDEFIMVISYFQIFINNHFNVYQSFQNLLPYTSEWMQEKIELFLFNVDKDKTLKPFMEFANFFKAPIAPNVMMSIFQMIDEGENGSHMMQFSIIFDQLSKEHQKTIIERKNKSLSSLSTFPLIGAGLITILLTFSILSIMGDMINVL